MEEKFIIGIFTAIIATLFTLVIKLVTKINKDQNEVTLKLNSEVHDLAINTKIILERISSNAENVTEMKENLTKFREDLTNLQLDNRDLKRFKSEIETRITKLENTLK